MKEKKAKDLKKYAWTLLSRLIRLERPVCQICQRSQSDVVHHIIKRGTSNYLYFKEYNLLAVCKKCDNKIHPQYLNRHAFEDTEIADILIRVIGIEGINRLENERHYPADFSRYKFQEMIDEYKQRIKEMK